MNKRHRRFHPTFEEHVMSSKRIGLVADTELRMTPGRERRQHRRHDLETLGVSIERWEPFRQTAAPLGRIVDLSASGIRIRCEASADFQPNSQVRVRMELPAFAGISPFIDASGPQVQPKREWIGWLSVSRVHSAGNEVELAGRLVDMDDLDRGMLGLYLSTQPLAA
jgi:hypothetical protein